MQSDIMLAAHLSLSVAYFRDFSGVHSLILCLVSTLGPGAEPRLGCDWRWSDWTLPLALPGAWWWDDGSQYSLDHQQPVLHQQLFYNIVIELKLFQITTCQTVTPTWEASQQERRQLREYLAPSECC